jgi:hypothetical protein
MAQEVSCSPCVISLMAQPDQQIAASLYERALVVVGKNLSPLPGATRADMRSAFRALLGRHSLKGEVL